MKICSFLVKQRDCFDAQDRLNRTRILNVFVIFIKKNLKRLKRFKWKIYCLVWFTCILIWCKLTISLRHICISLIFKRNQNKLYDFLMVVLVKSFIVLIRKQKTFITNSSCNVTFHYISVCILWYCKVIRVIFHFKRLLF